MRLATLALTLLTLASCDTTTNAGPPIRVLIEAVAPGQSTVLADVEVPRSELVGNSISIDVPRGIAGFNVSAEPPDSTGVYAVVTTFGIDSRLLSFGTAGSTASSVVTDDATSVTFISTDSLWTGSPEAVPVRIETGATTRVDTLRRDRHRASPTRLEVEARGLASSQIRLRLSVIAPRDLRLAPIARVQTDIVVPGGQEGGAEATRESIRLLRASLGDRARYVAEVDDLGVAASSQPLGFDASIELLLLRVEAER
ncbi:MAG: hypothetical protein AAFQ43_11980 [Bacteroidota bacterium]